MERNLSSLRPTSATVQPSCCNSAAAACPSPPLAPVNNAIAAMISVSTVFAKMFEYLLYK
jgi:hypothetical protein